MRSEDLMRNRLVYLERENQNLRDQINHVEEELNTVKNLLSRWVSACHIIFQQELIDETI